MDDKSYQLPDFKTAEDRQRWITEHAEYFTCSVRVDSVMQKLNCMTLESAEKSASRMAYHYNKPIMVYGCYGPYDTWVKNIYPQKEEAVSKA